MESNKKILKEEMHTIESDIKYYLNLYLNNKEELYNTAELIQDVKLAIIELKGFIRGIMLADNEMEYCQHKKIIADFEKKWNAELGKTIKKKLSIK